MTGALAALASAFCWALSAILFRQLGEHLPAMAMNLFKGLIAVLIMGVFVFGSGSGMPLTDALWLLLLSGLLGIFLGDTLYFLTLVRLGPRATLLLGTLIPISAGLIAIVLFDEIVGVLAWVGMALTLAGVSSVLWNRSEPGHGTDQWKSGIGFGLLFVLANAGSVLLIKGGVQDLSAMQASLVRHSAAIVALLAWGLASSALPNWTRPIVHDSRVRWLLILASVLGAFLGSWLSVVALKFAPAVVAVTLNSTSPLFILPLAAWFLRERVSLRSVFGAIIAIVGIGLYFLSEHQGVVL